MKFIKIILLSVFMSVSSFAQSHSDNSDWKIVPNNMVCMVTEMFFNTPQIPVEVNGKTYYGCCAGCKQTLTRKQSAREAVDPLSKKIVDKATATIAANKVGKVLYFENKQNFEKYMNSHSGH